ncbi:hypothetical protein [Thioalkalivibrio sp. ALJ9]|uniref:hypothetical protein n=1 Tax=Thioalkalivibrio sp. ALJ9 TaxID=1158758 RepID=UPI000363A15E|nr:hypothetical protein [Thioalkalivibrio sp. ALJ9]
MLNQNTQRLGDPDNSDQHTDRRTIREGTKVGRVLRALADEERHHRFTAERKLHDHCLHSTVAKFDRMGLRVDRQWVTVRGFEGAETRVMLYWLSNGQRQLARELLGIERGTA